ncbi:MAG: DUF2271 domain-containing protein [Crocinitomicaceae bacterium]|nr:DUF2271 domain-containing protein [Crocinitomicaceae bacterium]
MKKLLNRPLLWVVLLVAASAQSQTPGLLTFSFTQTAHTSYVGTKNVLAVWIEDNNGNFVKSLARYAGSGTSDHLPTWAVNSGGSSWNCMSSACNTVDAVTGPTLSSFSTRSFAWNGADVNETVVADGTYKVLIEECWNHGTSNKTVRTFTFSKGATIDDQTPADDGNFTSLSLVWTPNAVGLSELKGPIKVNIYPNPSTDGILTLTFENAISWNIYTETGRLLRTEVFTHPSSTEQLDLSGFSNGTYIVVVSNGKETLSNRVLLKK